MSNIDNVNFPESIELPSKWELFRSRFRRFYLVVVLFHRAVKLDITEIEAKLVEVDAAINDLDQRVSDLEP